MVMPCCMCAVLTCRRSGSAKKPANQATARRQHRRTVGAHCLCALEFCDATQCQLYKGAWSSKHATQCQKALVHV